LAVAKLFRIKPPSVSGWRKNGIPSARMDYLMLAYPHLFSQRAESADSKEAA